MLTGWARPRGLCLPCEAPQPCAGRSFSGGSQPARAAACVGGAGIPFSGSPPKSFAAPRGQKPLASYRTRDSEGRNPARARKL